MIIFFYHSFYSGFLIVAKPRNYGSDAPDRILNISLKSRDDLNVQVMNCSSCHNTFIISNIVSLRLIVNIFMRQHFITKPDIFSISNPTTRCYLCNIPVYDNLPNTVWHWDCEHVLPFLQGGFMLALAGTVAYEKSLAPVDQAERQRLFNLEYKWSHGLCNQLKNQAQFFGMGYVVQGNMVTLSYNIQESLIDHYLNALFDNATNCNAWNKWKEEWIECFGTNPDTIKVTLKNQAKESILQTLRPIEAEFNTVEATKDYNVNHDGTILTLRINFTKGALKHLSSLFTAHVMRAWRYNPNEWTTWVAPGTPVVPTTPVATGATPIQTILNTNGQPAVAYFQFDEETGRWKAAAIDVLTLRGERISEITAFIDPELFASFGLPLVLEA